MTCINFVTVKRRVATRALFSSFIQLYYNLHRLERELVLFRLYAFRLFNETSCKCLGSNRKSLLKVCFE